MEKKRKKRIFTAVLAALMLATAIPATALSASAETGSVSGNDIEQAGAEDTEKTETGGDIKQPEDTGLCRHHLEHDDTCGYIAESGDSEGSPCTYECRICPVEELIVALPDAVDIGPDNADKVRAQLEEILALFAELTGDEQEQIDLSRCYALQEAIDEANAPLPVAVSTAYREASWSGGKVAYADKNADCVSVENSDTAVEWTAGWYAVSGTVTIAEPITVSGKVNLILTDGCNLTAAKGIVVTSGNSLTIYAQSENGGTLNATGTSVFDDADNYYAAAGIGGGGGNVGNGGAGTNITIYGGSVTAASHALSVGGAGIGGGGGSKSGGAGGTDREPIIIYGGTVHATGSENGAGIGGGGGYETTGWGILIITGGTGDITITGGIVDASSPTDVNWQGYEGAPIGNGGNTTAQATVNKTTGIVFENGVGMVCGDVTFDGSYAVPAGYTLHIPTGASLSGSGTLSGGGTFTTDTVTSDMIYVPENLIYTGEDLTEDIKNAVSLNGTICGQKFVADTEGWTPGVEKVSDLEYTVKYIHADKGTLSKTVTVAKRALTVWADNKTVVRGNPMPAFTYQTDGLVSGDTFTTAPTITAGAQNTDTLGKYDIVINGGTLRNGENYRITYVNGTLNIVECLYTVTVTEGTGGGEYGEGDTVTVTANKRNGYTFTGWSSEDGVAFADSKAKTTTFIMPEKSVTVKANYTADSSGSGDGGNSGGSGNNSGTGGSSNGNNSGTGGSSNGNNSGQGGGGGGSTDPGNGDSASQIPVVTPVENTKPGNEATPGTGITPVNPGNKNAAKPGTGSDSGTASPAFPHASDDAISIDAEPEEEDNAAGSARIEGSDGAEGNKMSDGSGAPESTEAGQAESSWWIILVILLVLAAGAGAVLVIRKRGEEENS